MANLDQITEKQIGLKHFNFLLDDFSIWQHTRGSKINLERGYALDDAARALVLTATLKLEKESTTLLKFIQKSIQHNANFFTKHKEPIGIPPSDDAAAQVFWALSTCLENNINPVLTKKVIDYAQKLLPHIVSLRGLCYLVLGSKAINDLNYFKSLEKKFEEIYQKNKTLRWPWPEDYLTYGNAIIPLAYLKIGQLNSKFIEYGLEMLNFLNKETKLKGCPIAIGNIGWYVKGGTKSIYDQQPIDPAYQILANLKAYELTQKKHYLSEAKLYYSWFWGNNLLNEPLLDPQKETCRDGLRKNNLSRNFGAENIVCYLISQHKLKNIDCDREETST